MKDSTDYFENDDYSIGDTDVPMWVDAVLILSTALGVLFAVWLFVRLRGW